MKKKITLKDIVLLQGVIMIYTLSTVAAKFASGYPAMSSSFVLCYGLDILILGVYALLWQQMIKKFDLSIAYANRAMGLLWSMVWAVIVFRENITLKNIFGVLLVMVGTFIVNGDNNKESKKAEREAESYE